MTIVLTGGGTGGHVFPALSVAASLRVEAPGVELLYVGLKDGPEARLAPAHGLPFRSVRSGAMRGRGPIAILRSAIQIVLGTVQARRILAKANARAVLATGGYVTVPVALAARGSGVPVIVYLPDIRPGWAVRFTARLARRIATTNDTAAASLPSDKTVVTGYPVRPDFRAIGRAEARRRLGVPDADTLILITGATQGALAINEALAGHLEPLLEDCRILHVTGPAHYDRFADLRAALPERLRERYVLHPFFDDLPTAMLAADLAVMRAGASVLGELPAARLPAILIPYPFAGGHQRSNAAYLVERNAAVRLEESESDRLIGLIRALLADTVRRSTMREALAVLDRPDAARDIARLVLAEAGEARA